jgi:hypothetical protein
MKPINEFTENDGILIETEQESQEIREMLDGMGLEWQHKAAYIDWEPMLLPFVLYPSEGTYGSIDYAKKYNITLHPASDYLIKPGDEVEVRDGEGDEWHKSFYIGKNKKGIFVTEDDEDGYVGAWKYIRKAPNPKAKAIAEIKKIAEENGFEVEIL